MSAPAQHGGQGVAAAHDFAHGAEVGRDAVEFLGAAVGQPEAGHHLVENQRDVVAGGQAPKPLEETGTRGDDALQGLDYDRRQLLVMRLEDGLGGGQVVEWGDEHEVGDGPGDAAAVGLGQGEFQGGAGGDAHQGVIAAAVVASLEFQDFFPPGEGAGDTHGLEAGVGAAGGEADFFGAGDGLHQLFRQHDGLVVVGEEGAALLDGLDDRLHHPGMGVAQYHRPGTHQPIDVLVAAYVPDAGTFPPGDQEVLFGGESQVSGAAAGQVLGRLFQKLPFQWGAVWHG